MVKQNENKVKEFEEFFKPHISWKIIDFLEFLICKYEDKDYIFSINACVLNPKSMLMDTLLVYSNRRPVGNITIINESLFTLYQNCFKEDGIFYKLSMKKVLISDTENIFDGLVNKIYAQYHTRFHIRRFLSKDPKSSEASHTFIFKLIPQNG